MGIKQLTGAMLAATTVMAMGACSDSTAAAGDDFVKASASGPISGQIELRPDGGVDATNMLGVACMPGAGGMHPMVSLKISTDGRPFGLALKFRLPPAAKSGRYPLSIAGQNGTVRTTLQMQADGQRVTAGVTGGQIQLETLERGYAGEFDLKANLYGGRLNGEQRLNGRFRVARVVAGNC